MILPLTRNTDPIWHQKFQNIKRITPDLAQLVKGMRETLELTSGVGLAAPQVGKSLRLFIVDYGKLKEVFLNPRLVRYGKETDTHEEGCLSVPGTRGPVNRPTELEIEYLDLKGRRKRAVLSGYYARIAQHEYDHLSATFYVDRILDKSKIYTYKPIKLVFFGTPEFGATILKTLHGQQLVGEYDVQLVITAPDKPSGRGKEVTPSAVRELANSFKLPVISPENLKGNKSLISKLKTLAPDFIILASYGQIVPREILAIPKRGALNVHPSLLPKYRGATPIPTAIVKGEKYTGVTIIQMTEKLDAGAILASARLKIAVDDTALSLSKKLAELGRNLIHHTLYLAARDKIKARPQNPKKATYTKILTKQDGHFDWKKPPENLERMIRAYYPWPGVWTYFQQTEGSKQRAAKKILKLLPNRMVQLEGKKPISLKEFKSGHQDFTLDW